MNNIKIFLHIPKTAGTTLNQILDREYKNKYSFYIEIERKKLFEEFQSDLTNKDINLLRGHFEFGIHLIVKSPAYYLTFLRNPVDRVISEYYYILSKSNHPYHAKLKNEKVNLDEFVKLYNHINNLQVKKISGTNFSQHFDNIELTLYEESILETAKRNLENYFPVVGLTEHFDESLLLLRKEFGWDWPYYEKKNVTVKPKKFEEIPLSIIEIIKEKNQLDIELYEYAKQLFNNKVEAYGVDILNRDLKEFQKNNNNKKFVKRYIQNKTLKKINQETNPVFDNRVIKIINGFDKLEGPYPKLNLPEIIWGIGKKSRLQVKAKEKGKLKLKLKVRTFIPSQIISVYRAGLIKTKLLNKKLENNGHLTELTVDLPLKKGLNDILIKYKENNKENGRNLAVLFTMISVDEVK